ncbi:MAG TPA: peptidase U32 family protein [Chitinophagales bacterium]|jgi:putative protease|nr:U32 family peptidase [Chitinophagales bacterium]HQV78292.1 peptidase U32 family protein [Chitinophagales bacterium]HQW79443.1 peptidase U32 family protein [Chitinophagales bacterium]HRB67952.1 peptidase U32 family protein [Chitinophagales bacterium]HRB69434.1 peptidase U32 family protein [Chitinophagales bacterium]
MKNKIELMAPAGSHEALIAAIHAGCNSVYFGVEQFNMRARATMNFTIDDLDYVANLCKDNQVRSYLTLNTIIYDHDLSAIKTVLDKAKTAGITAVIASDQAVIAYARSIQLEVHISTQVNITNIETVKFYALFADTVVLSRELSLLQIKNICDLIEKENVRGPSGRLIEVEIFVHGALCMAVSGKCYLSLHTANASANRGACVQNCRRSYTVIDNEDGHELTIENEYIMSAQDLCTIDILDKIVDAGVKVFKIEGRGKGADYVKTVVECYREAIDAYENGTYHQNKVADWMERLKKVYNRGFWNGYYLGQELGKWTDSPGSKATTKKIYLGKGVNYFDKIKVAEFKIEAFDLKIGDHVLITGPTTGAIETQITELHDKVGAVAIAKKGDNCAFKLEVPIRSSDKLYKIVNT